MVRTLEIQTAQRIADAFSIGVVMHAAQVPEDFTPLTDHPSPSLYRIHTSHGEYLFLATPPNTLAKEDIQHWLGLQRIEHTTFLQTHNKHDCTHKVGLHWYCLQSRPLLSTRNMTSLTPTTFEKNAKQSTGALNYS
ncbi:MAG: hypothetical protein H6774_01580 [Pseudomonadales bacterium]|nr:hypothetical protein [Pseudomonadales bacterium]